MIPQSKEIFLTSASVKMERREEKWRGEKWREVIRRVLNRKGKKRREVGRREEELIGEEK